MLQLPDMVIATERILEFASLNRGFPEIRLYGGDVVIIWVRPSHSASLALSLESATKVASSRATVFRLDCTCALEEEQYHQAGKD